MEGELTSILIFVFVRNVCTMLLLALMYIFIAKEGILDTQWIVLAMYSIIMGDEGASGQFKLAKHINFVHVSIF